MFSAVLAERAIPEVARVVVRELISWPNKNLPVCYETKKDPSGAVTVEKNGVGHQQTSQVRSGDAVAVEGRTSKKLEATR